MTSASPPRPPPYNRRREHTRVPLKMSAEVHVGGASFTATTRDLSEGGCGLELKQVLTENSEVTLGLFLVIDGVEDERVPPLWVKGRVAWAGELDDGRAAAGIRFEVITEEQKKWVGQVLSHLTP
jgi:c-di-GMP-binding flagellar brake protein YcgR